MRKCSSSQSRTLARPFPQRPVFPTISPSFRTRSSSSSRSLATVVEPIQKDPAELDQVSTLPNGIRVATEALPGHFSGVGVFVDAGSRYENDYLMGTSHIMDRLAFKSTKKRTGDEMLEALESLGGNIHCASSRESLMYQSATFNSAVPATLALLAETIREPLITHDEVSEQVQTAAYEIGEIWSKPELILPELVHMAAFKGNTLGNPLLCPAERLGEITKPVIETYRNTFFRPERMVVAFAGVQHEEALRLTEQYFGDMPKSETPLLSQAGVATSPDASTGQSSSISTESPPPEGEPSGILSRMPFFKKATNTASTLAPSPADITKSAKYTGGFLSLPNLPPPINASLPPLTHIHLAFEAVSISSEDIFAVAVLQTLLGGGGSFSAGGPGKGMYSRLYTNVLNQHGWVESCVAFNHSYTDSGLFGITASCSPGNVSNMLDVMCRELQALTLESGYQALQIAEVNRAKNQLRSSLLMNLESRMVELEDLGRQVQVHGRKWSVREMCRKIDALTVKDLRRVARTVVTGMVQNPGQGSGAPTVVLQEGEEEAVTRQPFKWDDIQERISRWKLGRR
ncbi:hypothetical protein LZ554_004380 [Drepanopeziza brunnea f. sp. 'monogermtubi']|nr:hypothetical protein LZ554_004380 [Drepanopeziza brunnea f. sp. 'monogermtubi']